MIMRSIFTQASVQLHFLCFCFHSVILGIFFFFFFFFGFLHHCHCETTPLQEDIITHTSGVTSHYIVLHPVSSRASWTSGLCVQFIYHSWLVDYRNRPISDVTSRHVPLRTGGQACKQIARVSEKRVENIVDLFALW